MWASFRFDSHGSRLKLIKKKKKKKKNQSITQKTEKVEKTEAKKAKTTKVAKEKNYELPEIPDYERPVLEKPREFDFGEHVPREKTKLDRPVTQVRESLLSFFVPLQFMQTLSL